MDEEAQIEKPQILIYLAGPIDGVSQGESSSWRQEVAERWPEYGFFSPQAGFLNDGPHTIRAIDRCTKAVIQHCHGVLANLSGPGRGFGTIREIEFARTELGGYKPLVVVGDLGDTLMAWDVMVTSDLDEGMVKLMEIITDVMHRPHPMMGLAIQMQRDPEEEDHEDG